MTKHQRLILALGLFTIVVMGVFPPWTRTDRTHITHSAGYALILNEPRRAIDDILANAPVEYRVDLPQLTLQWTLVAVMMGIVLLFLRMRRDAIEDRAAMNARRDRAVGPTLLTPGHIRSPHER
jgi:hypothetical protein